MRRLWLIFAQAVTVAVAILFVVQTLRPGGLSGTSITTGNGVQILQEAPGNGEARQVASFSGAAQRALPSVVHIYTTQEVRAPKNPLLNDPFFRHFFGDRFGEEKQQRSGLGSGVVVSSSGYILTNNHVIEGADQIEVASNDGRKFKAEVVGTDPESDLAVLKVSADAGLEPITFAQPRSLKVGDVVLAIGNPFGVGQTVTSGIVSALDRTHLGINTFEDFIQTDAAINPGNSGGALVDSNGVLVGINTAIYSQSGGSMGIGFAIPVALAQNVLEQIIKNGGVTRGWIGVEIQEITPELADSFKLPNSQGALIAGVVRGAPADRAGIRPGDILLAVDDKQVKDAQVMLEVIAAQEPGRNARFKLRREGKEVDLPVIIGKRPKPAREKAGE
ncbi:MAG: Do family serine endopeptidase [Rhodocyclaceae bacterium]|jgi:Do/DeqQ family serine protease|nr:Do family serine endopeptidase [Rhodocyclaceae bacterium]